MKRAAIILIAIATLVLIGYPSAPLHADAVSSYDTFKTGQTGGPLVVSGGGSNGTPAGTGESGGGNEGDADGLSGIKNRPPTVGYGAEMTRVAIVLEYWWKFMLWIR